MFFFAPKHNLKAWEINFKKNIKHHVILHQAKNQFRQFFLSLADVALEFFFTNKFRKT